MRVAYLARSFLDYRIPVFRELKNRLGEGFVLMASADALPDRVRIGVRAALGEQALLFSGETRLGATTDEGDEFANRAIRIPVQAGLRRELRNWRPDVVVGDGFFQWTWYAYWQKARAGSRVVVCYERTAHTERSAQWYRTVYRRAVLRMTDAVVCSGTLCEAYTRSLGYPAELIGTGHMVADTDWLRERSQQVSREARERFRSQKGYGMPTFLFVGRLVARKGVRELLTAWARYEELSDEGVLVVVGDGPDGAQLRNFAAERALKRVLFQGRVPHEEMPLVYRAADILVMPTLEDNWSLTVPEAMSCGLPVLSSIYNGGHADLVQEGVNGWVFDPLSVTDTVATLQRATAASGELSELGNASAELIARWTPGTAADSILDGCRRAVHGAR